MLNLVHDCDTISFGCSIYVEIVFATNALEWSPVLGFEAVCFVFQNAVQKVVICRILKSESWLACRA